MDWKLSESGDPNVPEGLFKFLPEAEYLTALINEKTDWDLRLAVIGHYLQLPSSLLKLG